MTTPVAPVVASNLPSPALASSPMGLAADALRREATPDAASAGETPQGGSDAVVLRLPFSAQAAAAAFRLGEEAFLVFDERRPVDTARLRDDPAFVGLSVQLLQGGTLVRFRLGCRELGSGSAGQLAPGT